MTTHTHPGGNPRHIPAQSIRPRRQGLAPQHGERVWEVSAGRPAVRTLPDDPEELISAACSRIERNFTEAEWRHYFSDEPYRPTCPNLPGSGQP